MKCTFVLRNGNQTDYFTVLTKKIALMNLLLQEFKNEKQASGLGRHGVAAVSTVTSQQLAPGLKSQHVTFHIRVCMFSYVRF